MGVIKLNKLIAILLLLGLLTACKGIKTISMPEEMPEDFNFSVEHGYNKNNEINTYDGTMTKDLIENGRATANLTLSDEDMAKIYEKMKNINILAQKKFKSNSNCGVDPHTEMEWKITINGETVTHYIKEECVPTKDAKAFESLLNTIFTRVENTEAYQELPEAVGGYD